MKRKTIVLFAVVLLISSLSIWRSISNDKDVVLHGKTELNVQLQWFDGAQFCGLYIAKEKDFFDKQDLVVNLIPVNSYTSDPVALLTDGNVDIAIATADQVLINKDKGKEIKVIGTVFNRSLACFMYKKNNVNGILDFPNKKIAVYKKFDTENILLSLIQKHNLTVDSKNIIQAGPIDTFINDEVDVLGSYLINEPIEMRLQGIAISYIDPVEYGIEFYSDTYITKYETWRKKREILKKFLYAANQGWEYSKSNPEESIDIMFKHLNNMTKDDRGEKELESLKTAIRYLGDGNNNYFSFMLKEKWEKMEKNLYDIGRISNTGYINDLCDFEIINEIYEK